ncbi:myelin-associated glycoprotein [Leuresthes tenuis]|uniref:myelin-associated glycoprotein n=1 Tax=Leuresthes tenuis TaxID=355514 RepID=UPI003B5009D1
MDKQKNRMILCLLMAAISRTVESGEWVASVISNLDALVSSCVVVPCTFTHPEGQTFSKSQIRAIWHRFEKWNEMIYNVDNTQVLDSFRERTKLVGNLDKNNCSLEITGVRDHDTGPFCFRIELVKEAETTDKFSFVKSCVEFKMQYIPPIPEIISSRKPIQGKPFTVTCSVFHNCPSFVPQLKWNRKISPEGIIETHINIGSGRWRMESILTFIPQEQDDHTELNCTAVFHGGMTSSHVLPIHIIRTKSYNYIIIPVAVAAGTTVLFGLLCIVVVKKYKNRIAELQRRDGSMWNRLSRMSRRFRSDNPGPPAQRQVTFQKSSLL